MKINVKLGGHNSYLRDQLFFISEEPTMVVGGDVSHPGFGQSDMPSLAALVGM
jgi:eukaryotic translation initiation factor 2C